MYNFRISAAPPEATYRSVDLTSRIESASPHGLVAILYEELLGALGIVRAAVKQGRSPQRADALPRALTIFRALENGLDFTQGGEVAVTLASVYRGLREKLAKAATACDDESLGEVRRMVADLAGAWSAIR